MQLMSKEGLEPSWIAPHAPETCASTISPLRQNIQLSNRLCGEMVDMNYALHVFALVATPTKYSIIKVYQLSRYIRHLFTTITYFFYTHWKLSPIKPNKKAGNMLN